MILALAPALQSPFSLMSPAGLGDQRPSPEGIYALHRPSGVELLFLPGSTPQSHLAALIPLGNDALGHIEAVTRFWRAWHRRPVTQDTRVTTQQRRRLRLMLQAADGREHGASYREIARTIFGETRVSADPWKTSPLRDTVIGLVESAITMIGGGYLQLLRHRRRS
ncbi:DUF2285 domain-containing protein [Bradyrhizobium brasilense]|uniref:DUF2285 domain-containing protein n=1 Tax=Bradyrhizobium brasilense TaxID=1419277 RepID=UPI001F468C31|nr:DUF2285 domain-containing protein [Bradyrhizobium brasilense]